MPNTNNRLADKAYGEQIKEGSLTKGIQGTIKMTISKGGVPLPAYTNVSVDTPMTTDFRGRFNRHRI